MAKGTEVVPKKKSEYTAEDLRAAGTIKGIPGYEIETVITYGRRGEMQIYTCDNRVLTKLKKLVDDEIWKVKKIERNAEGELRGVFVTAPQKMLTFRKKATTRTKGGEDYREALIEEELKEDFEKDFDEEDVEGGEEGN